MDDEVVRFWQEFESETGERVEAKAIGELCQEGQDAGVWFLLVLTDRSFWFKEVPSDNWITSLFRKPSFTRKVVDHSLRVPREDLRGLEEPGPKSKSWFSRPVFPRLTLSWQENGETRQRTFTIDPTGDLLPGLRRLLPPVAP